MTQRTVLACPLCGVAVATTAPRASHFPFCSQRCQLIDLGKWLDEEYKVSEPADQAGGGAEAVTDRDRE
jgi:endogenous inhibitor of DNA gyrase (YacG/DUF329 family)